MSIFNRKMLHWWNKKLILSACLPRILLESISELENHRKTLHDQFNSIIETLNAIVVPTLYQAVTDVFVSRGEKLHFVDEIKLAFQPHFAQLTGIWKELQNDAIRLRGIANIFKIQARMIFGLKIDPVLQQERPSQLLSEFKESENQELITRVASPYIRVHTETSQFTKQDLEVCICLSIFGSSSIAVSPSLLIIVKLTTSDSSQTLYCHSPAICVFSNALLLPLPLLAYPIYIENSIVFTWSRLFFEWAIFRLVCIIKIVIPSLGICWTCNFLRLCDISSKYLFTSFLCLIT